jgi:Ca2+-binding EF-hand superfamily protein
MGWLAAIVMVCALVTFGQHPVVADESPQARGGMGGPPWMQGRGGGGPPWATSGGLDSRAGGPGRFGAAHFSGLDSDGDGKITKEEMLAMHAKADADGDGAVTLEELQKHIKSAIENTVGRGGPSRGRGGARPAGRGGGRPSATTIFAQFDKNKDGKLTKDEVPSQMWDRLAAADSDGDGSVSKREFEKMIGSRRGGPPVGAGKGRGMPPGASGGPPRPERILRQFDKNKDSKLTKDEVPEELWQRLSQADADGDGAVTVDEFAKTLGARGAQPASEKDEN